MPDINLLELISQGESETLKFKSEFVKDAMETIGAFANGKGGVILIGVQVDGIINGVTLGKRSLDMWANDIRFQSLPNLDVKITPIEHGGKVVVAIEVPPGNGTSVSMCGKYFIRDGCFNRKFNDAQELYSWNVEQSKIAEQQSNNQQGNTRTQSTTHNVPTLRVARPTNNIDALVSFYRDWLGLKELGRFENHDKFDGVMLGEPKAPYHLEFTHCHGHDAGRAPTQDNLLVFYIPDKAAWDATLLRMKDHGYTPVKSFNPYWDKKGCTFEDPDGYRVVLQNAEWTT
jgi:catechol 2,3-dioxygenase-like lactoylglutathione lyase family enzyme